MSETPPGWYPNPEMAQTQRYWDGAAWTDHIAPANPQPAATNLMPGQTLPTGVIVILIVVVMLVCFGVYAMVFASG